MQTTLWRRAIWVALVTAAAECAAVAQGPLIPGLNSTQPAPSTRTIDRSPVDDDTASSMQNLLGSPSPAVRPSTPPVDRPAHAPSLPSSRRNATPPSSASPKAPLPDSEALRREQARPMQARGAEAIRRQQQGQAPAARGPQNLQTPAQTFNRQAPLVNRGLQPQVQPGRGPAQPPTAQRQGAAGQRGPLVPPGRGAQKAPQKSAATKGNVR